MLEILLVDDDAMIRETLAAVLSVEGYELSAVSNGREALGYLHDRRRAPPGLILLDLMMPVMDGHEFLESYASDPDLPRIPIVVVSAHGRVTVGPGLRHVTSQLMKPLSLEALMGAVEAACPCETPAEARAPRGAPAAPAWGGPAATADDVAGVRRDCGRRVLVVEDDAALREAVVEILKDDGYETTVAQNGAEAIEALHRGPLPCVVLADLMMPVMTGWELIDRMRGEATLARIPVVVTSAVSDRAPAAASKVLAKPLSLDALLTTVGEFCAASAVRTGERDEALRELARSNVQLVELQRFRDEMSALIVHDMKSPLSAILCNLEYVLAGALPEEGDTRGALVDTQDAAFRLLRLVENLLHTVKLESGQFVPQRARVTVADLIEPMVRRRSAQAKEREIRLELASPPKASLSIDVNLVCRALHNLLDNAFRHTPRGGTIVVRTTATDGVLRIEVGNTGSSIPPASQRKIFDKFGQTEKGSGRTNLGLGLYFCRLVLEAHGGTIGVEVTPELPTVFVLELPL